MSKGPRLRLRLIEESHPWVALIVVASLFTVGFLSFLAAIFYSEKYAATAINGLLDGGLYAMFHHMIRVLFPLPPAKS